ncbi:Lon protease (ATP-dependent protease La) [Durusdinium trenchii]|uniref:Lon protease (ATP-dependent protease La) n=1 Tax=Durusdinium trenchii TaxID=1381693 RepID=A0ABP0HE10_9DINO
MLSHLLVPSKVLLALAARYWYCDLMGGCFSVSDRASFSQLSLNVACDLILFGESRKFHRIALGGVRDEAELRGHRLAFQTLGVNNPVILLDEVDKTSQNSMFNPQATLLEILDPEQNTTFKAPCVVYSETCGRSNAIFICTANDTSTIDRPLLDRMEVIDLSGYTVEEKADIYESMGTNRVAISRSHLLPKQRQLHALEKEGDAAPILDVSEEALEALVTRWTAESGVRSLERHLAQRGA